MCSLIYYLHTHFNMRDIERNCASVAKSGKPVVKKQKAERTTGGKKTRAAEILHVRQQLTDETAGREKSEQALEVSSQRIKELEAQLAQVRADLERELVENEASVTQLKEQVGEAQLKRAAMEVEMAALYGTIDAGEKQAAEQAASFKKLKDELAISREQIKTLKAKSLRVRQFLNDERAQREQREQELEVSARHIKEVEARAKASKAQLHDELAKRQEASAAQLKEAQAQREAAQRKCAAAEARLEKVQTQCDEMEGDMLRQVLAAGKQNAANKKLLVKRAEEAKAQIDDQTREINRLKAKLHEKEQILAQMTHQLIKEAAERGAVQGKYQAKIQKLTKKLTAGGERIKALEAEVLRVRQLLTNETARREESEQALEAGTQHIQELEAHAKASEAQLRREHDIERELWEVKETEWRHRLEMMGTSATQLQEQVGEAQAKREEGERRCVAVEIELKAAKRAASSMKKEAEAWAKASEAQLAQVKASLERELAEEKAATTTLNQTLDRMKRGIEKDQQESERARRLQQNQYDAELQAKEQEIAGQAGEINQLTAELRLKEEALAESVYQLTLLQRQVEFVEQRAAASDESRRHRQETTNAELKQVSEQLADLDDDRGGFSWRAW
jgi:chromosome segregation ATPase